MREVEVICIKDHQGDHKNGQGLIKDKKYLVSTDDNGFINFFDENDVSQLVMFGWRLDEIEDIAIPLSKLGNQMINDGKIQSFKEFIINRIK